MDEIKSANRQWVVCDHFSQKKNDLIPLKRSQLALKLRKGLGSTVTDSYIKLTGLPGDSFIESFLVKLNIMDVS